jgi:hypothetical protein
MMVPTVTAAAKHKMIIIAVGLSANMKTASAPSQDEIGLAFIRYFLN